ncbi:Yip1 family protein [uncultured Umboniibacter sp.]|uniref:Yip1 family protein n=1 Tax=uncultured Umboniibacter sp. TaxID=1798917 RepID=UPI00263977F5|nr:Yip1 family protein [uncultured Umboniibacter sp.]
MKLLNHTVGILTHPNQEWAQIRSEKENKLIVFLTHVPILALIPVLATYYGVTEVGWGFNGNHMYLTRESAASLAAISYVANMGMVYMLGEFINWMTETFAEKETETGRGMTMAVFLMTPVFLSGLVFAYPHLWLCATFAIAGIAWAVYLCYEGMPILMKIPKERAFMFSSSVMTVGLVLLVIMKVASVIVWSIGIGPEYTSMPS